MEAHWQRQLRARAPDRVVDGIVELATADGRIGAQKDADVPELLRAPDRAHGALDVLRRHDGHAEESLRCVGAELGQPRVVGVRLRLGELRVLDAREPEEHGRVEDRLGDAFQVHVGEPRRGLEGPRPHVAVAELAGTRALALGEAHARGAGEREPAGGAAAAVVAEPVATLGVGLDVPDAIAELRGRMAQHGVGMLEDVAVGVDHGGGEAWHALSYGTWRRRDKRRWPWQNGACPTPSSTSTRSSTSSAPAPSPTSGTR